MWEFSSCCLQKAMWINTIPTHKTTKVVQTTVILIFPLPVNKNTAVSLLVATSIVNCNFHERALGY